LQASKIGKGRLFERNMTDNSKDIARILVLISGNGSNLQALIDSCNTPALPFCRIVHVISNRKDAFGLIRARNASIPTTYHNLVKFKKQQADTEAGVRLAREAYDRALAELVLAEKPSLVVCAGWMHILSPAFLDPLAKEKVTVINLHPALPGQFNGADAIHRAYIAFQNHEIDKTGVMIHHVISEVDMGEPVVTREVPIEKAESEEDLEKRLHQVEWELIVEGTAKVLREIRARNEA
jgi:phosphoribosylglycinamide formyltransferase